MKKRIRELVIRISYSKYLWPVMIGIILFTIILSWIFKQRCPENIEAVLINGMIIVAILECYLLECFETIRKEKNEVLEKNKLINVVLSNGDIWNRFVIWTLCLLIFLLRIKLTFIGGVIFIIVGLVISIILEKTLAKFFKNRLV